MQGWFKLSRNILDWQWYRDINTTKLFIHLLLLSAVSPVALMGEELERGQLLTTVRQLSEGSGLTPKAVTCALNKLKKSGEIKVRTTNRYSVITVVNYEGFQSDGGQAKAKPKQDRGHTLGWPGENIPNNKNIRNKEIEETWPLSDLSAELRPATVKWLNYKRERNQAYGNTGLSTLCNKIQKFADKAGSSEVVRLIEESISNNWQGICWDKLNKPKNKFINFQQQPWDYDEIERNEQEYLLRYLEEE